MREFRMRAKCLIVGLLTTAVSTVCLTAPAPATPAPSPYPDTTQYKRDLHLEKYKVVDEDGLWFSTPIGLNCSIGEDGSYGCDGKLPGAPAGENEIGWFLGDPFPRLYRTDVPRFVSGAGQTILNGSTYIEFRGTRCAVTYESAAYCIHEGDPNSQIMVTTSMTWRGSVPSS